MHTTHASLGMLVRFIGLLVFGVAGGWLALDASWQLQLAALLTLFPLLAIALTWAGKRSSLHRRFKIKVPAFRDSEI
ncbi:MAG: hypothetical protein ACK8QZ_01200 [Anaerolineales bacterium]